MRSTSDSNEVVQLDDHLVVVDLEWSTDRAREYANKKGSVLVCDLRTHFSLFDAAIAEAGEGEGEGKKSICVYHVLQMHTSPNSPQY
jgi:hypothetical protein